MRKPLARSLWAVVLVVGLAACQQQSAPKQSTMPVYTVTSHGVSPAQGSALESALNIKSGLNVDADGVARYVDAQRYLNVPMTASSTGASDEDKGTVTDQAIDLKSLLALPTYATDSALKRVGSALAAAGLGGKAGPVSFTPNAYHTTFQMVSSAGSTLADKPIDTQVDYGFAIGGTPLVGPGAKIKIAFDPYQVPTRVQYAFRGLSKGKDVPITSPQQVRSLAQQTIEGRLAQQGLVGTLQVGEPTLVYYAPPLSFHVNALYPYYKVSASITVGNETIPLRDVLLPAVQDAPKVDVAMKVDSSGANPTVTATATVSGGTPPYSYHWTSASTTLDAATANSGPTISYTPTLYDRSQQKTAQEDLHVVVTDANALTAEGSSNVSLQALTVGASGTRAPSIQPMTGGVVDVGTEWIGSCGGLGGSSANAGGFVQRMRNAGVTIRFDWGNNNAWEQDFKDPSNGGNDTNWADNADFVFYTGHANGNSFYFCNGTQDDHNLTYSDASWGENDLEWLTVAACGPLQLNAGGLAWWQRWGHAFNGLHLLMGYATVTYDNTREGKLLAKYALEGKPLRQAWALTATDVQSESEIWSVMGVIDNGYLSDFNDHFHGHGTVGPDIPRSSVNGYWLLRGHS